MNDKDLELQLRAAGSQMEFPDPPDIATAVVARIQGARPRPQWVRRAYVAALAMGLLITAATGVLILSPDARRAVADLLGVPGIGIQLKDPAEAPAAPQSLDDLELGETTSIEEARQKASFEVAYPRALGPPEIVLYRSSPPGGMVTLIYAPTSELRASSVEGVGALLTEFEGQIEEAVFRKMVGSGTSVEQVEVKGRRGFWIEGTPHLLTFTDSRGELLQERARLAENVLLWTDGGVTYRLEGRLRRDSAIRIAESIE
jgi:hypothetical protein